jgi:hypothetical protein
MIIFLVEESGRTLKEDSMASVLKHFQEEAGLAFSNAKMGPKVNNPKWLRKQMLRLETKRYEVLFLHTSEKMIYQLECDQKRALEILCDENEKSVPEIILSMLRRDRTITV